MQIEASGIIHKLSGNLVFYWDGFEWVRSNKSLKDLSRVWYSQVSDIATLEGSPAGVRIRAKAKGLLQTGKWIDYNPEDVKA